MSKSDFDPSQIDPSRIRFASQDGVEQFEALAREFLPAILGCDFDETIITDESSVSDFSGFCGTREKYEAWEQKILQRIEDRHDVIARKRENAADPSPLQRRHQNICPALFHACFLRLWAAGHGLDRLSSGRSLRWMEQLKVSVWRGEEAGGFARYEVPARDNQTVLDVVTHIQRELDPSLAYRFACRVGMCGSCAMTVNGRALGENPGSL